MKYIDAERLEAEIERRIAAFQKNFYKADNKIAKLSTDGRIASLKEILPFITSLQHEQPEVDLEKEIDKVIADYSFTKTIDSGGFKTTVLDYEKIARHFAEWGEKNAYKAIMKKADEVRDKRFDTDYEVKIDPAAGFDFGCVNVYREGKLVGQYVEPKEEEKFSEGVEEAAKKYDEAESWRYEALKYPRREAFEAGAKWQKEQMMKESIDIKVIGSYNPICEPNERLHGISFIYDCKNDNQYLIAGDRAKIIIVKEEE